MITDHDLTCMGRLMLEVYNFLVVCTTFSVAYWTHEDVMCSFI